MKNLRFLGILLLIMLSMTSKAVDFVVGNLGYTIIYGEASVTQWYNTASSFAVVIPETVTYKGTTYDVTSIGRSAFDGCKSLTSIEIPNSVTSIGYWAFYNCSGLTSIEIPNSVTSIRGSAFYGCSGLTGIIVEPGNPKYDSRENSNAIVETESNTLITGCKNTVIPNSVTSIGEYAFSGCSGLTSITIPNSVTSIGECAFCYCSGLTSITIPSNVTSIGEYAFSYCSGLTSITIDFGVKDIAYDSFHGCDKLEKIYLNTAVVKGWFGHTTSIKEIVLGSDVTSIGERAFYYCSGLTKITIGDSVTSIGEYAFCGCSGLTSITIPNSVTSIADNAFINCSELKTVYNLSTLRFEKGITIYGYVAYYADKVINAPNGFIEGDFIFGKPNDVNTLLGYLGNSTELTLPADYKGENYAIGNSAFDGCSGLTSIVIPNSVTSIGSYAFRDCSGLTSIEIPNSVTSIGNGAFRGCSGLTSIEIPNSVTSIGNSAFEGCSSLETLYISNTIESIGDYAFANCNKILDIKIGSKRAITASENIFSSDAYNNAYLYVPVGRKDFYAKALPWSNFIIKEMDFTGIDDVKEQTIESNVVYDLSGRVVENPTKGIYIINGKKVLIK